MRKRIFIAVFIILILSLTGFTVWASTPARPMSQVALALQSDAQVKVSENPWLVFQPANRQASTGFIFYPGGRVDYHAYAPEARAIAAQGFLVVIVPMPLNLAVFAPDQAKDVMNAYPGIQTWAIGGHSLGGSMAAHFAAQNPDQVQGLVLWASYPAGSDSLAQKDVQVISIYGTLDGLATPQKIDASRALLPPDTQWVAIEGGDHAQFGWYGPQSGDNPAAISRDEQQSQVISATVQFLQKLAEVSSR